MFLFLTAASALAHEAPPQNINVSDLITLFDAQQVDSGWIPESGNLGVRVQIGASGTADVDMNGQASLQWPTDLNLSFDGDADGGTLALNNELEATVSLRFDVAGYQWDSEVATRSLEFSAEEQLQPFSLGIEQSLQAEPQGDPVIDYNTTVLLVVDVSFQGDLRPSCTLNFTGDNWTVDNKSITAEGQSISFPANGMTAFEASAVYTAQLDTYCELDFVPTFSVCVPIAGCTDWQPTEIAIDDLQASVTHSFPANELNFALPALSGESSIDFGEVSPNTIANQELTINNLGTMLLEGTATIENTTSGFSLFGGNFYIPSEATDSVVFAFAASEPGDYETTVLIASNDPNEPSKSVTLRASVVEGADGKGIASECGCAASTSRQLPYPLVCLLPLVAMLRRHSKQQDSKSKNRAERH